MLCADEPIVTPKWVERSLVNLGEESGRDEARGYAENYPAYLA